MSGVRLHGFRDVPGFSSCLERNVRTYVTHGGKPGVSFLSLDADNRLSVRAARAWFGLPYVDAQQETPRDGDRFTDRSRRTRPGGGDARAALTDVRHRPPTDVRHRTSERR
jgi:hypothetical protein